MKHLTPEQIDELLDNPAASDGHAASCPTCRRRLEEAMALRRRVRSAYETLNPDIRLEADVERMLHDGGTGRLRRASVLVLTRVLPTLAAAAALVIAVSVLLQASSPSEASAATAELAQIHQANLMPHAVLHAAGDPNRVAEHLRKELGFTPAMPRLGAGMKLRGCCVAHFRDRPVGSYVVDSDRGIISVIVLKGPPDRLELPDSESYDGRTYHLGAFARCRMAAVQIGDYTYCAVGEGDPHWLVELLADLLN